MLITLPEDVFTTAHSKRLLTVQQEIVLKHVPMGGMGSTVPEDANKCVLKDNLPIFFSIYVFKNAQLIQYITVIQTLMFVLSNAPKRTIVLEILSVNNV